LRTGRSSGAASPFEARSLLTSVLAVLVALFTILHGAYAQSVSTKNADVTPGHVHSSIVSCYENPSDDGSQTKHRTDCCVSVSGCSFFVPVTASALPEPSGTQRFALAPPFTSSSCEVAIRPRPPKLVVTV
jgi:hypothetical protein